MASAVALLAAEPAVQWRNVGPGGGGWIQSMLASRHGPDTFYVGCDVGGFYRSDDGGGTYVIHNTGFQDYFIESLAEHPTDPKILYAGCKSGVYKSIDGGRTWAWLREGFPPVLDHAYSAMVSKVALDPQNPETVYAAIGQPREERGGQGALYRSEDGGATWRQVVKAGQLPADLAIYDLAIHPRETRRLLIATARGVYASGDGGETWRASNEGLPPHLRTRRLAQSPSDPRIVYVSLKGKAGETPWQAGVYRSEDGGLTWQPRVNGLRQATGKPGTSDMLCAWVDRLVVHPSNPDVVYAGGATWWDATVYKTEDGGLNWRQTFAFGEGGNAKRAWITAWGPSVTCLTMSPNRPDTLYFGTSGYIYKTEDGGATWRPRYTAERQDGLISGTGLEVTCLHTIAPHPRVPGRVFFGFYDIGLLVSDDGGASFSRRMAGIPRGHDNSCFTVAFCEGGDDWAIGGFGEWGHNAGLLAVTEDAGRVWHPLPREAGFPDARPRDLIVWTPTVQDGNRCGARRIFCVAEGKGVFESYCFSSYAFEPRNAGLPAERIRCLARDGETLYAGAASGRGEPGAVFSSKDFGATWQRLEGGAQLADIRHLAAKDGRVVVTARAFWDGKRAFQGGVFVRGPSDEAWRHVYTNRFCEAVTIDPAQPDRVYVSLNDHPYHDRSTGGGVMASDDGGATWVSLNSPSLTCLGVTCLSVNPMRKNELWVGTGGNAVFVGDIGASIR